MFPARIALLVALACAAGGSLFADNFTDRQIERDAARSYNLQHVLGGRVAIHAQDGVATLSGRVDTQDQRQLAENSVDLLPNVRRVNNQVEVGGPPEKRTDGWIAFHVRAALLLHADVSAARTHVTVKDGEVILDGSAVSTAQKQLTEHYARGVEGVRAVLNNLVVREKAPAASTFAGDNRFSPVDRHHWDDPSITAQVRYELLQHHVSVGPTLRVVTHAGVVTLFGIASNQDEKEMISRSASAAPGVKSVVNLLKVRGQ